MRATGDTEDARTLTYAAVQWVGLSGWPGYEVKRLNEDFVKKWRE